VNNIVSEIAKYDENHNLSVNGTLYKNITDINAITYDTEIKENATYETAKYIYEEKTTTEEHTNASTQTWEGTVGDDGELVIQGIPAGEYQIKEVLAPDGYNILEHPIGMKVSLTVNNELAPKWDFTFDRNGGTSYVTETQKTNETTGIHVLRIENSEGTTLPTTGGMGTTIFYVLGSVLLVAAAVLLISKRRMRKDCGWN
jgi:LPXTG-motif cell wall-anchored protein